MVQKAYFSMQNGTKHFYLAYFTKLDKLRFLIGYLSIQKVIKHYYLSYFEKKRKRRKITKTMDLPLWKNANFATFLIDVFMVQKAYFSMQNGTKHFYLAYFTKLDKLRFLIGYLSIQKVIKHYYLSYFEKKRKRRKITKTMDLPLWKNANFATFLIDVFMVQKAYFSMQNDTKHFYLAYSY